MKTDGNPHRKSNAHRAWERMCERCRALPGEAPENSAAPFGFTTRMVAEWQAWRRDGARRRALAAWERMSLRAAVCGVAAAAVVAAVPIGNPGAAEPAGAGMLAPPPLPSPAITLDVDASR